MAHRSATFVFQPIVNQINKQYEKRRKNLYVSPKVKTVEIKTQAIICQSGGNESMPEYDWGNGGFKQS